jgi:hypothetical protein
LINDVSQHQYSERTRTLLLEVTAMPKKDSPGPSVKKPDTYEALRDKGMSKERAAKISNAQAGKQKARGKKNSGGKKKKSS